jgi:hypothetical protein
LDNKPGILNNHCVEIITTRGFFEDVRQMITILKPIKNAVSVLESNSTTLADYFIQLCRLAYIINHISISISIYENFRNYCIDKFNERWNEFEHPVFILAYFLHPLYRGKLYLFLLFFFYYFINFIN